MALLNDLNTLWQTHSNTVVYWLDNTGSELKPRSGRMRGVIFEVITDENDEEALTTTVIMNDGSRVAASRIIEDKVAIEAAVDVYLADLRTIIISDLPEDKI